MATGKVGDGYIEIHADDAPFRGDLNRLMSKVKNDLDKQAQDIGKSMGDDMGRSMRDALRPHLKKLAKDADRDLNRLNRSAEKAGKKAGKALGESMSKEAKKASEDVSKVLEDVKVNVDADTAKAKQKIDDIADTQSATVNVDADTGKAQAKLAAVARNRVVNLFVQARTKAVTAQLAAITKGLTGLGALSSWNKALTSMLENLPQAILKTGTLVGTMASLAGPALNLVAAIGPLGAGLFTVAQGAVAAGPAFLGLAAIFAVTKAAFSDLKKAQGEAGRFQTNTERWSQSWKNVAKDIQKAWFESKRFNNAFADMADKVFFTKTFREGLDGIARSLSGLSAGAMEGFTNAFDTKAAGTFFSNLSKGIDGAAPGFKALGATIAIIAEKGAPLFKGMGDAIGRWGQQLEKWATNTDIVKMAQDAYATWLIFWQMLKGIGNTLKNVFKAMTPPGSTTGALQRMADLWTRIAEVTASPVFKQTMAIIFAGAARGAAALGAAMAPLGQAFASLAPTIRDVLGLLGQLGGAVVTGLSKVLGNLDFQGALEGAVTAIRNMVAGIDFSVVAAALTTLLQVIAAVAPVMDDLLNAFLSIATAILGDILPALQAFSSFLDGNKVAAQALIGIIVAVSAAVAGFGLAMKALNFAKTLGNFESLGSMFEAFGKKVPKAGVLDKIGRNIGAIGGVAAVAAVAITTLSAAQNSMSQSASQVAGNMGVLAKSGTDLALANKQISDSLRGDALSGQIQGVGDAIQALGDMSRMGTGWFNSMLDATGFKTQTGVIKDQLGQMDQAIAQIASGGNVTGAQEAFRKIGEAALAQGESLTFTAQQFPQYQAQLEQTAASMGVAGLSAQDYANWMAGTVPAAVQTALSSSPELITALSQQEAAFAGVDPAAYAAAMGTAVQPPKNFAEAMDQATAALWGYSTAQLQLSGSQIGMESSFDAAADSAKRYGETLNVNTAAGRANKTALDQQATASQAYITSLMEQKAPANQVVAATERARSQYIKNAQAMGASKTKAEEMADAMGLIPKDVKTKVQTNVYGQAEMEALNAQMKILKDKKVVAEAKGDKKEVERLNAEIAKLHDKQVDITTNMYRNTYNRVYTTKAGTKYEADGGILGRVKAFARGTEKHVAQIASAGSMRLWAEPETGGEAYIPLAASKRARSLKIWQQTGKYLGAYASGGGVGGTAAVGQQTIAGLIAGMNGGKGPLSAALVGMMRDAVEDLKNYLGISSPSRLLKGYGLHTSGGLAEGVKKGAKKHGPSVSAALRRWVKQYVINAVDFKKVSTIYEGYGADMATALAYGIRDNGELLDETTSWLAERSSSIIKKEVDRINSVTAAANKKLSDKKKKANKAEDKVLDAQIAANNKARDTQIKALEKHNDKVKALIDKQNSLSNFDIWWKFGDVKGARLIADSLTEGGNWIAGTAKSIRNATLADVAKAQEGLQDLLDDATNMRDSVRDNLVGGFELKGLTSVGQLKTTLGKWVGQAKTFATKLRELAKKGYPKSFIQQVAGLGLVDGVSVANVLLSASDQEVAAITADYGELVAQATNIGTTVAETMFSSGQTIQEGLIAGLTSDISKLEKAAKDIAAALVKAVKKELGIKSPSKVMYGLGGLAVAGFTGALNDGQSLVADSMAVLTGAATPSGRFNVGALSTMPAVAGSTAGGTTYNLNINGNLIGANPKVEQAVRLLMEVIGDGKRYERAGWQSATPALVGGR